MCDPPKKYIMEDMNNTFAKFKTDLKFGNQNTIYCASMVIKLQYID